MNRKKKVVSTLKKKAKKANAKLAPHSNKPRYISKAEREKMALETEAPQQEETIQQAESVQEEPTAENS
ncbi:MULTISPECIES: DUF2986 domain-containing protein [unclassified Moritella]|uniref:DUF2986 domain-containing protein n=1 Tax=unclassified Moritella TaxID=2637987 RepID=UPI0001568865|nr:MULTISPECIES: DUF2986 domain-containing protein [unclassified Moritella]EDM66906.1 hypothetical protein PE36_18174 [Moritella sp. PE36]MBL1418009.1 DUF2986 domain-containing protein [Moritella sp.]MCJ8348921.1 DUF2986 domain-containing protein [Moritella sp.]NQZ38794.1 DUF2986 domain-containing protein [Moritella sp.]